MRARSRRSIWGSRPNIKVGRFAFGKKQYARENLSRDLHGSVGQNGLHGTEVEDYRRVKDTPARVALMASRIRNMAQNTFLVNQLLYTRVEARYSPQGVAGFQTVYHSGLGAQTIREIERRIRCFRSDEYDSERLQFFYTSQRLVVLSKTRLIDSDPIIVDKSQRSGIFLTHCLILTPQSYHIHLDNDPFLLFDSFPFLSNARTMIETFSSTTGEIAPAEVTTKFDKQFRFDHIILREAMVLVSRFLEVGRGEDDDIDTFILRGSPAELTQKLRIVFELLPIAERAKCTFDTFGDSCNQKQGSFFIVGSQRLSEKAYNVRKTYPRMTAKKPDSDDSFAYKAWIDNVITRFDSIQTPIDLLIDLALNIRELVYSSQEPYQVDPGALRVLWQIYDDQQILETIHVGLQARLGDNLSNLLTKHIYDKLDSRLLAYVVVKRDFDVPEIAEIIFRWIGHTPRYISEYDWERLRSYARQTGNCRLLFVSATFSNAVHDQDRYHALRSMSKDDYLLLMRMYLCAPIDPVDFVGNEYTGSLARKNRIDLMSDEEMTELIERLIQVGDVKHLARFNYRIRALDSSNLRKLAKLIKRKENIPESFSRVVFSAKPNHGLRSRFSRIWSIQY